MAAPKLLKGVDVSSFNGTPQSGWPQAAGAIKWVGVKLTEVSAGPGGSVNVYVNPDAAADWEYAASKKLGRIAYLFGHPAADVAATVDAFVAELTNLGFTDADGIMLDLEVTDGLSPAEVDAWAAEVLAELAKRLDRTPLVYTFLDFAWEGNCASLGKYPLWIADPSSPEGQPRVPAPWTDWAIDQFSTSGQIDRDVAKFPTLAAMQKALGKHEPPPEDAPMKLLSAVTLAGPLQVRSDGTPVPLMWVKQSGQPDELNSAGDAVSPGAGVALSSVNVRVAEGEDLRFAITETLKGGKAGRQIEAQFKGDGGWEQFTAPFPAQDGATYTITVRNYGPTVARIGQGTWELFR